MGKKNGKPSTRKGNSNRARSKNNPDGKRNDPKIDWSEYNKGSDSEGDNYVKGLGIHVNWASGSDVVDCAFCHADLCPRRVFIYCSVGLACFMNF